MKLTKMRPLTLTVAAALGFGGSLAHAGVTNSFSTLQDLINAGQTGVVIGDKQFYNFSYTPTPTTGANPAPGAAQISAAPFAGPGIGLTFSAPWQSDNAMDQQSKIEYSVHVIDSSNMIDGVGLHFNGDAVIPGTDTHSSVTKSISSLGGVSLGQLSTFSDGTGGSTTNLDAFLNLTGTRDLVVSEVISVNSGLAQNDGGVATISVIDNTFRQTASAVPLPPAAWMGLSTFGAIGLSTLKRKLTR